MIFFHAYKFYITYFNMFEDTELYIEIILYMLIIIYSVIKNEFIESFGGDDIIICLI